MCVYRNAYCPIILELSIAILYFLSQLTTSFIRHNYKNYFNICTGCCLNDPVIVIFVSVNVGMGWRSFKDFLIPCTFCSKVTERHFRPSSTSTSLSCLCKEWRPSLKEKPKNYISSANWCFPLSLPWRQENLFH